MTRRKPPRKPKSSRSGVGTSPVEEAAVHETFHDIVKIIEDAKAQGAFSGAKAPRRAARPSAASDPTAPFARIVAGAKTEDRQLRALEAAAQKEVALPVDALVIGEPVELIVLACKSNALRCRLLGTARELTVRTAVRDEVPGEIVSVVPTKQWTHAGHPNFSGKVASSRTDVEALGLTPLAVKDEGEWDPEDEYWGEEGEPIEEWAKPIIAHGKRRMFEMEQVIPGADPEDWDCDPIIEASELNAAGHRAQARELLMAMLAKDLRCLDAHAHLGNFEFDHRPEQALRHYQAGVDIGVFSLGKKFNDVLAWGLIDNRPFLRCLQGLGLCWWRLGKTKEAAAIFRKMLWLNPSDNQGGRFNLAAVEAGRDWEPEP